MDENAGGMSGDAATVVAVSGLNPHAPHSFSLEPDANARADIAKLLGITAVRKLRFDGRIEASGTADWRLVGHLGATVVQRCVVTLDPVTTRIEEPVARLYLAEPQSFSEGSETEMPVDDGEEPLRDEIDLSSVVTEALSLALPPYPRTAQAKFADVRVTEPGKTPMTDEDARPFAALKSLRDQMKDEDGNT
ncbi:MAG: DUF177 domain-containing protein [Pseudomonadota bacterium]